MMLMSNWSYCEMSSGAAGDPSIIPDQDLWVIFLTWPRSEVSPPVPVKTAVQV